MANTPQPTPVINPVTPDLPKVALIVGTEVVQVMAVDPATKAALMSNPIFVDLGFNQDRITAGDTYNATSGKFIRIEDLQAQAALQANN